MEIVTIREPFDRVSSPMFWALLLDAIDATFFVASTLLGAIFFPLGLFRDLGVNIIQTVLSSSIFETPFNAAAQLVDFILPSPLDQFPPNTLAILFLDHPEWLRRTNNKATQSMKTMHSNTQRVRFLGSSRKPAEEAGEVKHDSERSIGLLGIDSEKSLIEVHAPKEYAIPESIRGEV